MAPFVEWFEQRVAFHHAIIEREARLAGTTRKGASAGARRQVLAELGWPEDADDRRTRRWQNEGGNCERALLEDALESAGVDFAELYPELVRDDVVIARFCPTCDEDVATDRTLVCPWCESPTNSTTTCPSCGGLKSARSRVCIACVERDERGYPARYVDQRGECPACGGHKTREALTCWGCFVAAGGPTGRKNRKGRALQKIDQATLERGYELYQQGLSVRQVARAIHPDTRYASVKSCANSLHDLWQARGWPLRNRVEAIRQSNADRAFRPQCSHIIQGGRRRGQRCPRRSIGDDGLCWHHKPENLQAGIARIRGAQLAAV